MMNTPWLDLNPEYQRDVVWGPDRMTKLINSLMAGYYVPPIIFNVKRVTGDDGIERFQRISIDGKQRLSSIRSFFAGEIPCLDRRNRKWWFTNCPTAKGPRHILPHKFRRDFLKTVVLCAEYSNLDRVQEEDLFSRVQLGVPLSAAEKLRATTGPWQQFAVELQDHFSDLFTGLVDDKRGKGFQIILSVFYHVVHPNASGVCGARQLGKFCNSVTLTPELHEVITGIFMRYQEVYHCKPITFKDPGYLHCKKFSPLEFLGMSVLIHRYPTHTALKLSQDILEIRHMLLRGNNELLTNNTTWKFFMDTLVEYGACQEALAQRQSRANRHFGCTADGSLALGISPSSTGLGDVTMSNANGYSTRLLPFSASSTLENGVFDVGSLQPSAHGSGLPILPHFAPQRLQSGKEKTPNIHQLPTPLTPSQLHRFPKWVRVPLFKERLPEILRSDRVLKRFLQNSLQRGCKRMVPSQ
jgi:hypothetical protein